MSTQAHYFKIGLFVITSVTLIVVGTVLLGAGVLFRKTIPVETYFNESVQGLDIGSPVKYRGVQIGNVENIDLVDEAYMRRDPNDSNSFKQGRYIMVRIALDPGVLGGITLSEFRPVLANMIENGLRVRLASQGLTGTAYLETDYFPPKEYPPLEIDWVPTDALYVPSAPSTINRFATYVEEALRKLDRTNIDQIGKDVERLLKTLTASIEEEVSPSFAQMTKTLRRLDQLLTSRQETLEETIDNARVISENLKDITSDAKKYPSQFIFGDAPERIMPGEK